MFSSSSFLLFLWFFWAFAATGDTLLFFAFASIFAWSFTYFSCLATFFSSFSYLKKNHCLARILCSLSSIFLRTSYSSRKGFSLLVSNYRVSSAPSKSFSRFLSKALVIWAALRNTGFTKYSPPISPFSSTWLAIDLLESICLADLYWTPLLLLNYCGTPLWLFLWLPL